MNFSNNCIRYWYIYIPILLLFSQFFIVPINIGWMRANVAPEIEYQTPQIDKAVASTKYEMQIREMQNRINMLEGELSSYKNKTVEVPFSSSETSKGSAELSAATTTTSFHPLESVCYPLPKAIPSSEEIWMSNIGRIFQSGRRTIDTGEKSQESFESWRADLLEHFPAHVLRKSVKTLPSQVAMRHVMEKVLDIRKRREAKSDTTLNVQSSFASMPKELNIVVLGGSVTMGVNCPVTPLNFDRNRRNRDPTCAWPKRLEMMLSYLLGQEVPLKIVSIAAGGTDSGVGKQLIDFDLITKSLDGSPDIIINAYSTNDMHIIAMRNAAAKNMTLADAVFETQQSFVRSALSYGCGKDPPLLIFVDDYLGNEQNRLKEIVEANKAISQLAVYYDFMFISYADAVRRMVYGGVEEKWFSPTWINGRNRWVRQIHPTMGMHIAMAYAVAFNILNAVISFCNEEAYAPCLNVSLNHCDSSIPRVDKEKDRPGSPSKIPDGLPPLWTDDLMLHNVSSQWRQQAESNESNCDQMKGDGKISRCSFVWIAGVSVKSISELKEYLHPFSGDIATDQSWDIVDDHGKLGLSPSGTIGDKIVFALPDDAGIRFVYVFAMKSYGEKWSDSAARLSLFRLDQTSAVLAEELSGWHDSLISVTYTYKFDLGKDALSVEEKGRLEVELIGGQTFKITGLALCAF